MIRTVHNVTKFSQANFSHPYDGKEGYELEKNGENQIGKVASETDREQ